jgi:ribonuclease PH
MARPDGRQPNELRPITFERDYTEMAAGSVLVSFGRTRVLCTASIDEDVPRWMKGKGKGWVTAEYSMLPGQAEWSNCRDSTTDRSFVARRVRHASTRRTPGGRRL